MFESVYSKIFNWVIFVTFIFLLVITDNEIPLGTFLSGLIGMTTVFLNSLFNVCIDDIYWYYFDNAKYSTKEKPENIIKVLDFNRSLFCKINFVLWYSLSVFFMYKTFTLSS